MSLKIHSQDVTEGDAKAGARAMLRAVGLTDDDFAKPQIGLVSAGNEVTPCNVTGPELAARAKEGVIAAGGVGLTFATIAVSDGISMGHEGMRASLVSREVIADSVELVMHGERFDGMVTIAGCDKSLPGMLMAAARTDLPSVFLYGGSSLPGRYRGKAIDIVDVFEGIGAASEGRITRDELYEIEKNACPGAGSCAGMFTANTMASVGEAIGMSLPGSSSIPAVDPRLRLMATASGEAVMKLLAEGIRPHDIMTRPAFENAITTVMALGGSTNAVLHLLAIAHEMGVELTLDDFDAISRRTPHIGDLRPFGRFHMVDLDGIGGVPVVLRALLDEGLLVGDVMTITGRTMAENLEDVRFPLDQEVIRAVDEPLAAEGGIAVLKGSLAPNGAVVKVAGIELDVFSIGILYDEVQGSAEDELPPLLGLSFLLIVVILAFIYRSLSDVVIGVIGLMVSIIWMYGFGVLFVEEMNRIRIGGFKLGFCINNLSLFSLISINDFYLLQDISFLNFLYL